MWTISREQIAAMSASMQHEFERRACFAMTKEKIILPVHEIKRIVCVQAEKIKTYNLDKEKNMMQLIRLSFKYPVLQAETLPESLHEILSSPNEEDTKMKNLVNHLNINDYGI
jgi:hypothetical protein